MELHYVFNDVFFHLLQRIEDSEQAQEGKT
jgi:hypothetical protein